MTDELRQLVEQSRVLDCINRLFIGTDNRDWDAVRACFAPRVHFDMTSLAGGEPASLTPAEITEAWEKGLAALDAIHHQTGNHRVWFDGEEARAFCYGTATHYRKTWSGRNTRTFVGSYDFSLRRHGAEWRITSFRFNLKYMDGNLKLDEDV